LCCDESVDWDRQALVWVLWPEWVSVEETLVRSRLGTVVGMVLVSSLSASAAVAANRTLQGSVAERCPLQSVGLVGSHGV